MTASRSSPGWFARLFGGILTLALLALALTFSLVVLALIPLAGFAFWLWFRWRTRHLRRAMRTAEAGFDGGVIEGDWVRSNDDGTDKPQLTDRR